VQGGPVTSEWHGFGYPGGFGPGVSAGRGKGTDY
jgi:hypothetical protein